jgi:uncharacterized membrane protein
MRANKKRMMTVALIVTGLAIVALGTTLFLAAPSSWPYPGHMGNYYWQGQDQANGVDRDSRPALEADGRSSDNFVPRGYGMFRYYGMHGPGNFAGGALVLLGVVVFGAIMIKRRHGDGFDQSTGDSRGEKDALAVLRREFAEGRLSEEEYRHRLEVLQE